MTGRAAQGPTFPSPRTALPSEMTAILLPLPVYSKAHPLIFLNGESWRDAPRDIGQGHILLVVDVDGGVDLDLPPCLPVESRALSCLSA